MERPVIKQIMILQTRGLLLALWTLEPSRVPVETQATIQSKWYIRCRILAWKNECRLKTPKIKAQKFEDPAIKEMYQKVIEEKTSEISLENRDKDTVDKIWKTLKYTLMNAATEILGYEAET